jgi:hypothetical protein
MTVANPGKARPAPISNIKSDFRRRRSVLLERVVSYLPPVLRARGIKELRRGVTHVHLMYRYIVGTGQAAVATAPTVWWRV